MTTIDTTQSVFAKESAASSDSTSGFGIPKSSAPLQMGLCLGGSIICFLVAMTTLSKVNWPAYLEYPAVKALAHLQGHLPTLSQGYWAYLFSVLCLLPIVALVQDLIPRRLGNLSAAFGLGAVLFKCLGIARWLFVMPYLITSYGDSVRDPAMRSALEIQYEVLNRYSGGLGEQLGVALFTGLWIGVMTMGLLSWKSRWRVLPMILGAGTAALWFVEVYFYTSGGSVGVIRTVGSILTWVFLALFIASAHAKQSVPVGKLTPQ